jgi:hypothetical protein
MDMYYYNLVLDDIEDKFLICESESVCEWWSEC